jgi:magnesium transporter
MLWRAGGETVEGFPLEDVSDHLAEAGALVWVDLCAPTAILLDKLAEELSFDPHAVEDALASAERPKATRHASHTFVTVRRDDRLDIDEVVARWQDNPRLREEGPDALLHGLLDVVVDGHFDTIQVMDEAIESLEDDLFDERADVRDLQRRTYRLRKELTELRRLVLPMREVVSTVMRHRSEDARRTELDAAYTDLYDHVLRATEWTESLRDMVTTVFETNLALQDARLNAVMKKLTGWAAIIAVPTAVTGWFGMNVAYPGIGGRSAFVASTVVISLLAVTLYLVFKRLNWI